MKTFQPVIKWSGSKRSQARDIVSYFPKEIDTYYEPFCGGASVLRQLMETEDIRVNKYVCSDTNVSLIGLWIMIKDSPQLVFSNYQRQWNELNSTNEIPLQKEYYLKIRDKYNKERNPLDFMFLNRTCFNGLIRYNKDGEFNVPFHMNRSGITPDKFEKIIYEWSDLLNKNNVSFKIMNYTWIRPKEEDFMYLDPPYANTNGMYDNNFKNDRFFKWLGERECGWVLSYDGRSGNEDNTFEVPDNLYDEHVYLKSGNSSFKRLKESDKNAMVYESLYIKKQ